MAKEPKTEFLFARVTPSRLERLNTAVQERDVSRVSWLRQTLPDKAQRPFGEHVQPTMDERQGLVGTS